MGSLMALQRLARTEEEFEVVNKVVKALDKHPRDLEGRLKYYNKLFDAVCKKGMVSDTFKRELSLFVCSMSDVVVEIRKDEFWRNHL